MKKNKNKFLSILALGTLTVSLALTGGCGKNTESAYVAVICKSREQYWNAAKTGVTDAGKEMNIRITYEAPEKEDVSAQVTYVNKAVSEKADAIVIAPVENSEELVDALKKAQDTGIKVITIDSDVNEDARSSCISTNNKYGGAIAARKMSELIGGKGNIGIITHAPTSPTAIDRKSGFISQIDEYNSESADYSLNVVSTENGNGDIEQSRNAALKLINDNPEINAIFATNQGGTIGACMAVDELGKADTVQVIGFDSFDGGKDFSSAEKYTQSGVLDGFIVQSPYNMGYLGIRYSMDLINGQNIATAIDTGATFVNIDNINNSDIKLIINPVESIANF